MFANPFLIDDPAGTAEKLAPLVGRTSEQLLPLLSDRKKGFIYLRRKMDPGLGEKVDELEIEGIGTVVEPRRTYPQGAMASQLLGSVGHRQRRPVGPRAAVREDPARRPTGAAGW